MNLKGKSVYLCLLMIIESLLFAPPSEAASEEQKLLKVKEVRVTGNRMVSEQLILSQLKIQKGMPYSAADIQKDIQRLFSLGFFSDIKVDVFEDMGEMVVTYIVTERKVIKEVLILGNTKVKQEEIAPLLSIKKGDTYIPKSLEADQHAIIDLYEKRGYANVAVEARYREISPTEVEVIFNINEGVKARIKKIEIFGNRVFSDKEIRKAMRTRPVFLKWFGGIYEEEKLKGDIENIVNFYKDHGFMEAEVQGTKIDYAKGGKGIYLTIVVEEGPQYFIKEQDASPVKVFGKKHILDLADTEPGDVYSPFNVARGSSKIQNLYYDYGYIMASIKPSPSVDNANKAVDIVYYIDEGNMSYVDEIKVLGNIKTKDNVIRREVTLYPGERFDGRKIKRSQQKVTNLGYFSQVAISTEPATEQEKRKLVFEVEEQKTGTFNFGAGFSSDSKFIGQIELSQNNFDIFNFPSFTGAGQRFQLLARPGTVQDEYRLAFTNPYFHDKAISLGFDIFALDRNYKDYDQDSKGTILRLGKHLTDYTSVTLSYTFQNVDITDVDDDAPAAIEDEEGSRTKSSVTTAFTIDTRDNILDATSGHRDRLSLELAGGPLAAETDFLKLLGETSWYFPLTQKLVLMLRGEVGLAQEFGDSDVVPIFDRFFVGGTNSVRGYDFRDIGPKDDNDPIGGKAKVESSAEFAYPIIPNFKGYLFFDAGQAYKDINDFLQEKMNMAVGVGVGVKTPLGPVRVDFGLPLNPDEDQGSGQVHFTTGLNF